MTAAATPISDEKAFLAFARGGDTQALERLLAAHLARAYAHARRRLGPGADADDAVQEAYLQLARSARRYDGSVPFAAWLARLVHLACLRVRRAQRSRRHQEPDMDQPARAEREEPPEAAAIRAAVERLPERYRAVIDLHYFAGLSQEEVGRALGLTTNSAAVRIHRARERLRRTLAPPALAALAAPLAPTLTSPSSLAPCPGRIAGWAKAGALPRTTVPLGPLKEGLSLMPQHPLAALSLALLVVALGLAVGAHPRVPAADATVAAPAPPHAPADPPRPARIDAHLAWEATLGDSLFFGGQPALGERIALAVGAGELVAFDRASGAPIWRVDRYYDERCGVALAGAIVVDHDHALEALDPLTGQPRWRLELAPLGMAAEGRNIDGQLTVDGGVAFFAAEHGGLMAIDPATGAVRWRCAEIGAWPHVWVTGAKLLVATAIHADHLSLVDAASGRLIAERPFSPLNIDPAAGRIERWRRAGYEPEISARIIGIDAEGRVARSVVVGVARPTRPDDRDHAFPALPPPPKGRYSLSSADGHPELARHVEYPSGAQGVTPTPGGEVRGVARSGDDVIAITGETIVALTAAGEKRWSAPCRPTEDGWSLVGRTLWCGTTQGEIVAYDVGTGAELARIDLNRLPESEAAPKVVVAIGDQRWSCVGEVACAADERGLIVHTESGWVVAFTLGPTF